MSCASKDALFDGLASVAKAIGHGHRAQLVDMPALGERSVDQLAAELGQSVADTSHHLQKLLRTGLVRTRRDRNRVIYRLASPAVKQLWWAVRTLAAAHVAAGHITGMRSHRSISLPGACALCPRAGTWSPSCRGPKCVYADGTVRTLLRREFRAADPTRARKGRVSLKDPG